MDLTRIEEIRSKAAFPTWTEMCELLDAAKKWFETNGKLSKPGYTAQTIISEMDDATTELVERETAELVTKCNRLEDAVEGWKQMVVKLGYTGLVSKVERLTALVREMANTIDTCVICDCDPDLQSTCESCELVSRAKAELAGKA